MKRLLLGLVLVAVGLGLFLVTRSTPAPVALAARHAPTCGFWADDATYPNDGSLSARPGHPPSNNELAHVEGSGAWQVCYDPSSLTFYLKADIGMCLGINSGEAAWQNCDTVQSQEWTLGPKDALTGARRVHNRWAGGVLCAEGPPPAHILSNAASTGCRPKSFMSWLWASQPQRHA